MFSQGTIRGKITDENGEALIGATVYLKTSITGGVLTDFDGNYSLKVTDSLPKTLVASYISYTTLEQAIQALKKNEVLIKNITLSSAQTTINEVVIVAKQEKAKEYYMENLKKSSAISIDYISSETMKKTGDNSVVAAVARVSGVSTNGDFITVRGIGDRYVRTTINGARIPTLDPFTNNIRLDLFPASLVDNIIISKTANADLPGDWAGAYLSVETKDYPEKLMLNVETQVGYNNQSSLKNLLASETSSTDWLGYDNNFRDHDNSKFKSVTPMSSISGYDVLVHAGLGNYFNSLGITKANFNTEFKYLGFAELGLLEKALFHDYDARQEADKKFNNGSYKPNYFKHINQEAIAAAKAYPNNWDLTRKQAPLNFSQSFSLGNQTTLFGKPLGYIGGFRYGSSVTNDPEAQINRPGYNAIQLENAQYNNGWSGLINLAYKYSNNHSLSLLFMPNFLGVSNVREGIDSLKNGDISNTDELVKRRTIFYEERRHLMYQLKSEHYLPIAKMKIELNVSYTNGNSNTPDFKDLSYVTNKITNITDFGNPGDAGSPPYRIYRKLKENLLDGRLNAELPISKNVDLSRKIKFGVAYQHHFRKFDQNAYNIGFNGKVNAPNGSFNEAFKPDNFDIDPNKPTQTILTMTEWGRESNHTFGYCNIKSAYALVDYAIYSRLRFSGGVRLEHTDLYTDVDAYDSLKLPVDDPGRYDSEFNTVSNPGFINRLDILPSASLIFKIRKNILKPINLRLNYSQSIARPSLREYSESTMFDYELNNLVIGNSTLKFVNIQNYDFRLESYFKSGDNVSLSLFYKNFKNHIEILFDNNFITWFNAEKSDVKGIELEGRKKLTKYFELRANVLYAMSNTTYEETYLTMPGGILTYEKTGRTVSRTMLGQAPYVLNGIFTYMHDSIGLTATISYNLQGPRLVVIPTNKDPNVYEMPRHLLDFKTTKTFGKHWSASFTIRNLLNAPIRRSYKYSENNYPLDFDRIRAGTNYQLGITYKI